MSILGVVLAGGQSRRFGSDKAMATLDGRPLLAHAIDAIGQMCDSVVVAGRESDLAPSVADQPCAGMGPLGGLAGALVHARAHGHDAVLSTAVDCATLPAGLLALLQPAPAYLDSQPVIGLWPADAADALIDFLSHEGSHAVRAFADRIGARPVCVAEPPPNINTPQDLLRLEHRHGI